MYTIIKEDLYQYQETKTDKDTRWKPLMKAAHTYIRWGEESHDVGDTTQEQEEGIGVAPTHPAQETTTSNTEYHSSCHKAS